MSYLTFSKKYTGKKMLKSFCLFVLFINSAIAFSQLKPGSKVYLSYAETPNEVNVNAEDAKGMLKDYLIEKTSVQIVDNLESSEFTIQLSLYEKNMGDRSAKLAIIDNTNSSVIYESKWVRGTMNAFYGYSGSRHAIGRLVKSELSEAYPSIEKKDGN